MVRIVAQIEADDQVDVPVLDLDRDAPPIDQARLVNLAEGRAGHRLGVERRDLAHSCPELALQSLGDLPVGAWRHLVLQRLELGHELGRQEVRHDRQELSYLDEEPLEPEDGRVHAARVPHVNVVEPRLAPSPSEDPRS